MHSDMPPCHSLRTPGHPENVFLKYHIWNITSDVAVETWFLSLSTTCLMLNRAVIASCVITGRCSMVHTHHTSCLPSEVIRHGVVSGLGTIMNKCAIFGTGFCVDVRFYISRIKSEDWNFSVLCMWMQSPSWCPKWLCYFVSPPATQACWSTFSIANCLLFDHCA